MTRRPFLRFALAGGIALSVTSRAAAADDVRMSITTDRLSDAKLATVYQEALHAKEGTGELRWTLVSGALPPGLQLSSAGVIHGTPEMDAPAVSTFSVKATGEGTTDGVVATKQLSIATKAGIAGVRRAAGTFFKLGAAVRNFAVFSSTMGRSRDGGDPIRYLSLSFGRHENGRGFLSEAKGNATVAFKAWTGHTDVTLCIILPLYTLPDDVNTHANRTARLTGVAEGKFDDDFRDGIFRKAIDAGMAANVVWRLGHEAEISGSTWFKLDQSEMLWRKAWERIQALGKSTPGGAAFRFDYQGNGPFFSPVSDLDRRERWEYALPDDPDVIGCDLYIGAKSRAQVLAEIIKLQAVAASKGKPFSIPEIGAWTTASGRNKRNHTDADVSAFVQEVISLLETFPANGPGSCLYWNWFEGELQTSLMGIEGNSGNSSWPRATPVWSSAWKEYKAQLGN